MCCKKNEQMIIGMWTRIEVLSGSWKGFTKFTLLKKKLPKGHMWSGRRLKKFKQLPDLRICGPGGTWKGDILVADIEEVEKMDASEIYPRRINAEEVLTPRKGHKFIFPIADHTTKFFGKDHEFREPTLRWEPTCKE